MFWRVLGLSLFLWGGSLAALCPKGTEEEDTNDVNYSLTQEGEYIAQRIRVCSPELYNSRPENPWGASLTVHNLWGGQSLTIHDPHGKPSLIIPEPKGAISVSVDLPEGYFVRLPLIEDNCPKGWEEGPLGFGCDRLYYENRPDP